MRIPGNFDRTPRRAIVPAANPQPLRGDVRDCAKCRLVAATNGDYCEPCMEIVGKQLRAELRDCTKTRSKHGRT